MWLTKVSTRRTPLWGCPRSCHFALRQLKAVVVFLFGVAALVATVHAPYSEFARGLLEVTHWIGPQPGSEPSSERVFPAGRNGVSCFRVPAIVRTSAGTLVAFAEARHGSCGDGAVREIVVRRSFDEGRSWSAVGIAAGGRMHKVSNPNPIAMSSGAVVLLYANHVEDDDGQSATGISEVTSDNDGETWGTERNISVGFGKTGFSLPGPGAGLEVNIPSRLPGREMLKRLLCVTHGGGHRRTYVLYSDDGAKSWHSVRRSFKGMSEGALVDLGGGHVLLSMRHQQEGVLGRAVSRSTDGGLTWSKHEYDGSVRGPGCHGSLAAAGGSLYFSNPASSSARVNLTIRRSEDGGRSWVSSLVLQGGESWGYSSMLSGTLRNRQVGGILYEASDISWRYSGSIDFAVFPLDFNTSRSWSCHPLDPRCGTNLRVASSPLGIALLAAAVISCGVIVLACLTRSSCCGTHHTVDSTRPPCGTQSCGRSDLTQGILLSGLLE